MSAAEKINVNIFHDSVTELIRTRTWQSVIEVKSDKELLPYLKETFLKVAELNGKSLTDFSIADIKRAVDSIHDFMFKLNLEQTTLTQINKLTAIASTSSEVANLITFAESVAGLTQGNFAWLLWHISKNVASPKIKRATAVYIAGRIAANLYGEDSTDILIRPIGIDPILETMDLKTLQLTAKCLDISESETLSRTPLIKNISQNFSTHGRNAIFSGAESYIETLITVAIELKVDIRGLGSAEEIEAAICSNTFNSIWEKLDQKQREQLIENFKSQGFNLEVEHLMAMGGLGTIGAASLGGFATYAVASTTLGFLSSSLGIALPFTAYTGLSSVIATAIGPAGIVVAAFPLIYNWLKAKPLKLISAIAVIASWRAKTLMETDDVRSIYKTDIQMSKNYSDFIWPIITGVTCFIAGMAVYRFL